MTENAYKSFNESKTIDELKYNMLAYCRLLKESEIENKFLMQLLNKPIYKSNVLNLYETLEKYKRDLNEYDQVVSQLLEKVDSQIKQISGKIECEDVACDSFFLESYDGLEQRLHKTLNQNRQFKAQLFEYLESVIKNT